MAAYVGGTLPGLVLVVLSVLVDPDLDLLLGFGGVFLILVGGVVGTLAGREEDQMDRRSVAGGAAAGAAVGAMFFSSNRCLEPCWCLCWRRPGSLFRWFLHDKRSLRLPCDL